MNFRRAAPAVVRLESGLLIVVGGKNAQGCLESSEVLDTRRATWSFEQGPKMRKQRGGPTAAVIDGSKVLVIGGHDDTRTHDSTEILTIAEAAAGSVPGMSFTQGPFVTAPRSYAASVMLNASHLFLIGGHDGVNCIDTTEVLNLSSMEFTT